MHDRFDPQASFDPSPDLARALQVHSAGCDCARHTRRRINGWLLGAGLTTACPAFADGVTLPDRQFVGRLIPAEQLESTAQAQYRQLLQKAAQQNALAPADHPQVVRLRAIAQRLIPYSTSPNLKSTPRAAQWKWEVNLIGSKQINAFCMPGGKIAFFSGILEQLKLTDDEVAMVMGHETAHALREHARSRTGTDVTSRVVTGLISSYLGLGSAGSTLLDMTRQGVLLKFSRSEESEADKIGLDLAARAGYDPAAGVTLWEKMGKQSGGRSVEWLSTHPSSNTRIREIRADLPLVQPLFERAAKPTQRFDTAPPHTTSR